MVSGGIHVVGGAVRVTSTLAECRSLNHGTRTLLEVELPLALVLLLGGLFRMLTWWRETDRQVRLVGASDCVRLWQIQFRRILSLVH